MRYRRMRIYPLRHTSLTGRRAPRFPALESNFCPLVHEWVTVAETCVTCPEYQEKYFIPFVSRGQRECRFTWEWHREVDEAITAEGLEPSLPEYQEDDNEPPDAEAAKADDEFLEESVHAIFGPRDQREDEERNKADPSIDGNTRKPEEEDDESC